MTSMGPFQITPLWPTRGTRSGTTTWCGDPTIRTTRASGRTTEQSLRHVFGSVSADKHRILIDNPARCVGFDVEALRAGVARHVRECLVQRHPRLGGPFPFSVVRSASGSNH